MDTAALREYLGMVVDLEKNIFLQENLMRSIQRKIDGLSILTMQKPVKPLKQSPPKEPQFGILEFLEWMGPGVGIAFFIALFSMEIALIALIGWGIWGFTTNAKDKENYQSKLWKYNAEQKELERKYEEEMREYRDDQVMREQLKVVWGQDVSQIKVMCEETKGRLRTAYAKDIVFPKYRNLTMVTSIYEYLCAGRCTTLDGHEGAYNILETEIRLDQIIVQLDRVIANLEKIQQNQYMLYSAIQESNAQSARLLESTDRMAEQLQAMQSQNALQGEALTAQIKELQKSSELTAYHAERTQKELAYMNRMDYLTGRNDGPFRNTPPV